MKKIKIWFLIFFKAGYNIADKDGIEHAGYMAFVNILSLFPFLIFILALTGFIGETSFGLEFIDFLVNNLPDDFISALKPRIKEIMSGPPQGLLTISILGAIWTASSSVEGYRTILNKVYQVKSPPAYILRRLMSIAQFLALSVVIVLLMFMLVFVPIAFEKLDILINVKSNISIHDMLPVKFFAPVSEYLRHITLFFSLLLLITTLYYIMPNKKMRYEVILPGALITVVGWMLVGSILSSFIHRYEQLSLLYGSLAGIIIAMIFFFILNIIFIYGAEVNHLISKKFHKKRT